LVAVGVLLFYLTHLQLEPQLVVQVVTVINLMVAQAQQVLVHLLVAGVAVVVSLLLAVTHQVTQAELAVTVGVVVAVLQIQQQAVRAVMVFFTYTTKEITNGNIRNDEWQ
jgi:hypothetical protein